MAAHSSILAWRNPWTEEPGELQSMRSQRVGRDQSNWTRMHFLFSSCIFAHFPIRMFYNPCWLSLTPPGQGKGSKDRRQAPPSLPLLTLQGSPCDCWAQWEFQYPMWVPTVPLVGLVTDLFRWMSWFPSWPSLPPPQQWCQCILIHSLLRLESRLCSQPSTAEWQQ